MFLSKILSFCLLILYPAAVTSQDFPGCLSNYATCAPNGASTLSVPSDLSLMYTGLLDAIHSATPNEAVDEGLVPRTTFAMCCMKGTLCGLLQPYGFPFCYDNFTTDFSFPDSSYGTLSNGSYHAASGTLINLFNGSYTSGTSTGNIYAPSPPPNTATLCIPTPYTSAGVGSAIPATALGGVVTYTTVIGGTTVPGSTAAAMTTTATVVVTTGGMGETVTSVEVESAMTVPGSTVVVTSTAAGAGQSVTKTGGSAAGGKVGGEGVGVGWVLLGVVANMLGYYA